MKKGGWKFILLVLSIILILIAMIVTAYYIYFFSIKCVDSTCFENALLNCNRASYTSETSESIIDYNILGKSGENCKVNVKMLQMKAGAAELAKLEGKTMVCLAQLGVAEAPEKNLQVCSGSMKETIQEIIIKRMHSQIVENIGKVSEEVTKIL